MANWATTDYVIEGSKESLDKIYDAIINPDIEEKSSEDWEGNVLRKLNIDPNKDNLYLRGFIQEASKPSNGILEFYAEEAWGATDFEKALTDNIKDIKVYWKTEEGGCDVFATNDKEGRYFPKEIWVRASFSNFYAEEYCYSMKGVLENLNEWSNGKIKTEKDIKDFTPESDGDFINVLELEVVE